MKIETLRQMSYGKTFVYILHFGYIFMYLFSHENQIYMQHVIIKPPLWRRVLCKLHFVKNLYTKEQRDQCEQAVLSGAMKSLDLLLGKEDVKIPFVPVKPIPVEK